LAAWPRSVSAQARDVGSASPGESALELQLDSEGVQVSPLAASVAEARAHAKMKRGVQAARRGVWVSTAPLLLGLVIGGAAAASWGNQDLDADTSSQEAAIYLGLAFMGVGAASMIATGSLLGVRKRKLRKYEEERSLSSNRIRWDPARSRLVF
jgi:hypothetical protein